jgi:pimeloyl-ACP methyl ester carboxylesterase
MTAPAPGQTPAVAITTAGLRGTYWNPELLPAGVTLTTHPLTTEDGSNVVGYLFRRGGEKTVVCTMHPRELVVPQYVVPELLQGGVAVWLQGARSVGNDIRLEHEGAVLDLAAGQRFLVSQGFEKRVLLGISGGGPLASMYAQQAGLPGEQRIKRSPAGKPTGLDTATLPPPDGIVLMSTHPGQGKLLLSMIDPSVVDENDALSVNEALSPFNPKNGFKRPPESASYAADWLLEYRAAQLERVKRIDAFAKAIVAKRAEARKRMKEAPSRADAITAAHTPIFNVWRTDADPRCFDLSLDPSERAYGSLWGANPIVSNYGSVGFARTCTAESWLSNWSGLSSNATMEKCAPAITQPTLMIEYTGDNSVFPAEADRIYASIGAADKERHKVHGNHHGQPVRPGMPVGQREAGRIVRDWLARKGFA